MPFSVTYIPTRGVVLLCYTGPLDEDLVEEGAISATTLALEHSCGGFLVDTRDIEKPLSPRELVTVGRGLGDLGVQPGQRVAVLASPFEFENEVLEVAATQAGFTLRTFSDQEKALRWLGLPAPVNESPA